MAKAFKRFGLVPSSQVPTDVVKPIVAPTLSSADAKKFGLENFCNNCYANSVIQALYYCTPFRDLMLQAPDASLPLVSPQPLPATPATPAMPLAPNRRKPERKPSGTTSVPEPVLPPAAPIPPSPPSLFSALRSLFLYISTHPQERGTVSPRAFIEKLKEVNRAFDTTTHQDAHEFLNYLLNKIVEEVEDERKTIDIPEDLSNSVTTLQSQVPSGGVHSTQHSTLVHRLFEGVLTSETRCLTCETVSSRDESFLDLSIDIEQNSSVTACLRQFSASEMLCHKNKFFCDSCCDLQEAEKRMKIKRLPNVLALHLKRFKYQEESQRFVKLAYRVAFPFELRLFNTVDEMDDADRLYNLFGIVVHIGNGPHHGHYVSIIKTMGNWLLFDDDNVSPIAESEIPKYFGDGAPAAGCAYVLYYQAADIDMGKLGLRPQQAQEFRSTASTELSNSPLMRPPGLVPEDAIPIPTPSDSSSELGPPPSIPVHSSPPSSFPSDSVQPTPILNSSAPSIHTSISTSSTHSHSPSHHSHPHSKPPPAAPPITGSHSSPTPSKATVTNILNNPIHKTPSMSIRTSTSTSTGSVPPPLPSTPTWPPPVNGIDTGLVPPAVIVSPVVAPARPNTHAGMGSASRALPIPPRPLTGDPVLEREREREKEKEGGWSKWFGAGRSTEPTVLVNGVADVNAGGGGSTEGEGSAVGEVDANSTSYLSNSSNGGGKRKDFKDRDREKDKERGKGTGWFTKRKSFRIGGEKAKGGANSQDAERSASDAPTSLRTSLQLPQRRGSESGDGQTAALPPPVVAARSTPGAYDDPTPSPSRSKYRSRPVSTHIWDNHLQPQPTNGNISPTHSSASSFDSGNQRVSTPTSAIPPVPPSPHHDSTARGHQHQHHHHNHPPRSPHYTIPNGHPPPSQPLPPPPPRIVPSLSTPPTPPPTNALPKFPSLSPYPRTHTLPVSTPEAPPVPVPASPSRKKSITNFPVFRGREKEKEKEREREREKEKAWDAVAASRASIDVSRDRERDKERPLPPVPIRGSSVDLRAHQYQQYQVKYQHQRQGSVFAGSEVQEPVEEAPGLASFGSANTSVASTATSSGANGGFKRATRKLSLTAPMLGFGKRDKEKEKEKAIREKAEPHSFSRV